LADDALAYSKRNKWSYKTDVPRFAKLKERFGAQPADEPTLKRSCTDLRRHPRQRIGPLQLSTITVPDAVELCLGIVNRKVALNPAPSVMHRREDSGRIRFLTEEEEKRLGKIVQEEWPTHLPELDLTLSMGIRKGSQYGLTWDMVDWESRELHIPRTKNEELLHVPLNDVAIRVLTTVVEIGNGDGRVFVSAKTGEPLENGRHWFDDALTEAKLNNFHRHDLRHTFASRLRMKGAPLEDIADLLGHKSLTTRRRYAHLGPNKLHSVRGVLAWCNCHHK
jgi:integrase